MSAATGAAVARWPAPAMARTRDERSLVEPAATGLTGEITISFADESGIESPFVAQAVAALRKANPDAKIKVDRQKLSGIDYITRLLLAINSGNAPDVFHINSVLLGELADAGFIEPLDPYLATWPDWQQYPDNVKQSVSYQGKVWGIPYGIDVRFLYYRKDIFEQAGLPRDWRPETLDGILAAARTIKAKVPDVIPYAIYAGKQGSLGTAVAGLLPLVLAYGGTMLDPTGKWYIDSCPIRESLAYYRQAFQIDKVVPTQVITTPNVETVLRDKFGKGELAIYFEGVWTYGPWHDADPAGTEQNVGYVLHPTANGKPPFSVGGSGTVWHISAKSKAKDLAWEFVKTWNNADTVAQIDLKDPHPPSRRDAAAAPAFQADKFLVDAANALPSTIFVPPDPHYRQLIGIVQEATELVATGEASPEEAVKRYGDDLKRILGDAHVVAQPCP